MKLRAGYSTDTKKAALIHELGHRLNYQLSKRPKGLDEHRVLFLYLYDVWQKLYGEGFADEQVTIERNRGKAAPGRVFNYDYDSAWGSALSLGEGKRAAMFREIANKNKEKPH